MLTMNTITQVPASTVVPFRRPSRASTASTCCAPAACVPRRRQEVTKLAAASLARSFGFDATRRNSGKACSSSLRVFAASGETGAEDDSSQNDSPDTKAVKFLIGQGVKRIQALEAYNKASQTAYWTNVKLADNVYEVVSYLQRIGIDTELGEVVSAHPSVLAYSVPDRLAPALDYLMEVGVTDVASVIIKRPSLLGLDPQKQLKRVVEYFQANDYSQEEIVELISTSV